MPFTGRPRKYDSVEDFVTAMTSYFDLCERENATSIRESGKLSRVLNVEHLCSHMGIVKDTLYQYAKRTDGNGNSFSDSVKMASQYIAGFKIEKAALGFLKEITTIFDLKNNHGYVDKTELTVSNEPEKLSAEDIKRRLQEKKKLENQSE
jgi:hypothetical protein